VLANQGDFPGFSETDHVVIGTHVAALLVIVSLSFCLPRLTLFLLAFLFITVYIYNCSLSFSSLNTSLRLSRDQTWLLHRTISHSKVLVKVTLPHRIVRRQAQHTNHVEPRTTKLIRSLHFVSMQTNKSLPCYNL
jgi:hypothetical protein